MKLKYFMFLPFLFLSILLIPSTVMAWSHERHDYMCPEDYDIDCKLADYSDFQKNYPYGSPQSNHLCLDNRSDGLPRLIAKYYVKKYYLEEQKDSNLLGAAAHLLQDASCPDHWYPTLIILGHVFVPFIPSWVGKIEYNVESYFISSEKDWNIPIKFQGKVININEAYLNKQKEYIKSFLANEPEENIEELQKQIESKILWHNLRIYKEWIMFLAILGTPFFAYDLWKWKRKTKTTEKKTDLIETTLILLFLATCIFVLTIIHSFY